MGMWEVNRRATKILTLEERRTGLASSIILSHFKLWELYYEHGAKWRRFKNGECGVVSGSRFMPIRILAMKFIKLSIMWIPFPGIYSWKTYTDIPGQLCKNALSRSWKGKTTKCPTWADGSVYTHADMIKSYQQYNKVGRPRVHNDLLAGWAEFVLGNKASNRFCQGLSISRMWVTLVY